MKKFVVGRFLDYKMVDSKTMIISQVQDLQVSYMKFMTKGWCLVSLFKWLQLLRNYRQIGRTSKII